MSLHRYWRIHTTVSTSGSDAALSLFEAELRASVGGVDQCSGGTASASHSSGTAVNLFDDVAGTYWANGGPSEASWFQYDFGISGEVDVKEISITPRYASQSPSDFSLQYSDNGVDWLVLASWSGVTDWGAGVERFFVVPGVMVSNQCSKLFALSLGKTCENPYSIGLFIFSDSSAVYALTVEVGQEHPWLDGVASQFVQNFDLWLESAQAEPFSLLISVDHSHLWKRFLSHSVAQPLHDQIGKNHCTVWSLRKVVRVGLIHPVSHTVQRSSSQVLVWSLQLYNSVYGERNSYWNLSLEPGWIALDKPAVLINDLPISLVSLVLTQTEEKPFWQARLKLAKEVDFSKLSLDDVFSLKVGGETFVLMVHSKRLSRPGKNSLAYEIFAVSPSARYSTPRASLLTQSWSTKVWAKEVVESLLSESVQWTLPQWRIAANRLVVKNRSPMQVVQHIAGSVGGVVQTNPDGSIHIRPHFPVNVPAWNGVEPDHLWTDAADILEIEEVREVRLKVDRVRVSEGLSATHPDLFIELDKRESGANRGNVNFSPGDTAHFLVTPGAHTSLLGVDSSTGSLIAQAPTLYSYTEELAFVSSNTATLSRPMVEVDSVVWLGRDLGAVDLEKDGKTLISQTLGTAIARVTGKVDAQLYQFKSPQTVANEEDFPVLFSASSRDSGSNRLEIVLQRGNGIHPEYSIVDPLLSDYQALYCRANHELDQGEELQPLTITLVYRSGLQTGQLVEVQDGLYGQTFRGVIQSVQHEMDGVRLISKVTVLK